VQARENYQQSGHQKVSDAFLNNYGKREFNWKCALPDSAQIFYRRALSHNNFGKIEYNLATIADYAGLTDNNPWNLANTVETNILEQLREYGHIDSYEKVGEDPKAPKYIIRRFGADSNENSGDVVGSVKRESR